MILNDVPHDAIVHDVVTVNQDVAEGDDLPLLRNLIGEFGAVVERRVIASPTIINSRSIAARSMSSEP